MGNQRPGLNQAGFRAQVYQAVCRQYEAWYGREHMGRGSCLYWTLTGAAVLQRLGYRPLLQAGSLSWPIVPPDQDDGRSPTHFTYEWSPERPESQAALKLGLLPEIHIWIGLPDQNELVDFSTRWLPAQAAREGLVWRTLAPPDFLWCGPSELPERVVYRPDLGAIRFILNFIAAHQQ